MTGGETIWVLGAGRFGQLAIQRLERKFGHALNIAVIDRDASRLKEPAASGLRTVVSDAVDFLLEELPEKKQPKWIIPCVPFHLAARWLHARLSPSIHYQSLPRNFHQRLPNTCEADNGGIFSSQATFLCPDDCPEPANLCTVTGLPRSTSLFLEFEKLSRKEHPVFVVRSHQIAPGLGGIRPAGLIALEHMAAATAGDFSVATACRCHGVVHGFRI